MNDPRGAPRPAIDLANARDAPIASARAPSFIFSRRFASTASASPVTVSSRTRAHLGEPVTHPDPRPSPLPPVPPSPPYHPPPRTTLPPVPPPSQESAAAFVHRAQGGVTDLPVADEEPDAAEARFGGSRRIVDRESDYSKRRLVRTLSPARETPADKAPAASAGGSYAERVREAQLERERDNTMRQIAQKQREEAERVAAEARSAARDAKEDAVRRLVTGGAAEAEKLLSKEAETGGKKRRNRWDAKGPEEEAKRLKTEAGGGEWEDGGGGARSEWDAPASAGASASAPTPRRARSRWDETPCTSPPKRRPRCSPAGRRRR